MEYARLHRYAAFGEMMRTITSPSAPRVAPNTLVTVCYKKKTHKVKSLIATTRNGMIEVNINGKKLTCTYVGGGEWAAQD